MDIVQQSPTQPTPKINPWDGVQQPPPLFTNGCRPLTMQDRPPDMPTRKWRKIIKPEECPICPKGHTYRGGLNRHILARHRHLAAEYGLSIKRPKTRAGKTRKEKKEGGKMGWDLNMELVNLKKSLTHAEAAFLAEMELVTVVPRQRLESIDLLSGQTPPLRPPHRTDLPLWLALLLKKQRRANILPPAWLHPNSLSEIILHETKTDPTAFSPPPPPPARAHPSHPGQAHRQNTTPHHNQSPAPKQEKPLHLSAPFLPSCTASAPAHFLPYHWQEVAEALLAHAGDDVGSATGGSAGEVRRLLRDLAEVRAAKLRSSTAALEGFGGGLMGLRGVGAVELAESRGFVLGVVDGVRRIGASAEAARREEEEEGGVMGRRGVMRRWGFKVLRGGDGWWVWVIWGWWVDTRFEEEFTFITKETLQKL
ncbi:GINS complex protein-domain-containing protein [Chaetomium sp. MPI-CAGE-AT-0009]|nr:GINS complex protein-domain-containing protein [Chaetomium sp. MPI-CAGE-AT-0009]